MTELLLPSGRKFDGYLLRLMAEFAEAKVIQWVEEAVPFKSKLKSHVYVSARDDLTENTRTLNSAGGLIYREVMQIKDQAGDTRTPCLIGIPMAGGPLATVAQCASGFNTRAIISRVMRTTRKDHGVNQGWTNSKPQPDRHWYMTVDNALTRGSSILQTTEQLREDGYPVEEMWHIVLIDRNCGGIEELARRGITRVKTVFNLDDIVYAFRKLQVWDPEMQRQVEEELERNRTEAMAL